jgi:hypothetical protein
MIDKPEIALDPPAPTAKAVLVHRKKLEIDRDALCAGAAELALKSARGSAALRRSTLDAVHKHGICD